MTEDNAAVQVSVDAVYRKYREQADAELARLRHALASAEAAVEVVVAERDEARAEVKRLSSLPQAVETMPARPRVPEAPGAGQQPSSARH